MAATFEQFGDRRGRDLAIGNHAHVSNWKPTACTCLVTETITLRQWWLISDNDDRFF
jgi:hypothetical protein